MQLVNGCVREQINKVLVRINSGIYNAENFEICMTMKTGFLNFRDDEHCVFYGVAYWSGVDFGVTNVWHRLALRPASFYLICYCCRRVYPSIKCLEVSPSWNHKQLHVIILWILLMCKHWQITHKIWALDIYIGLWSYCLFEIHKIAVCFPLAFIARSLQGHWWG